MIEPSINGYKKCIINRPYSICLNYACVSNKYTKSHIYGDFTDNNPMSSIDGKRLNRQNVVKVPIITLEKILDTHLKNREINLLSLDVEGYELFVLEGINLNKYRPNYILVEIYKKDYNKIVDLLQKYKYNLHSNFTNYNNVDNPGWDGSHNDYLFVNNLINKNTI